jgi:cell division GTPase FtsZ
MAKQTKNTEEQDDFILDVSDVPMPPEEVREQVEDEFRGSAPAFKLCFLGVGQGGGRLAQQFWQYGYRRVCAVNSAIADIQPLELPNDNKLTIGVGGGAGGSPEMGAKIMTEYREDVYNLARKAFGAQFDRIMITATAGGGTGAGGVVEAVNVAHDLLEKLELNEKDGDPRVGVIMALPKDSDGKDAHANAARTLAKLVQMEQAGVISPLILLDNQRIDKLFPKLPAGKFWQTSNHAVCSIFHLLNVVAAKESKYTSFDKQDFAAVLKSGLLVFGSMPVRDWQRREGIGVAIRDNLSRNTLVGGLNLRSGSVAGCVLVAKADILDNQLPQEFINDGLSMLGRMIKPGGAVKHGIYAGNNDGVVVYTMIGGLDAPTERLAELARIGGLRDWDGA